MEGLELVFPLIHHIYSHSSDFPDFFLGERDLQSLLNSMSQQQLMQLFGNVGGMSGLSSLLVPSEGYPKIRAVSEASKLTDLFVQCRSRELPESFKWCDVRNELSGPFCCGDCSGPCDSFRRSRSYCRRRDSSECRRSITRKPAKPAANTFRDSSSRFGSRSRLSCSRTVGQQTFR